MHDFKQFLSTDWRLVTAQLPHAILHGSLFPWVYLGYALLINVKVFVKQVEFFVLLFLWYSLLFDLSFLPFSFVRTAKNIFTWSYSCVQEVLRALKFRVVWQISLLLGALVPAAGSLVSSLVVGQPPTLLKNDYLLPSFMMVWWAVHHSPLDLAYTILHTGPVQLILVVLMSVARARGIFAGIEEGQNAFHTSTASIILALISGTAVPITMALVSRILPCERPFHVGAWTLQAPLWISIAILLNQTYIYMPMEQLKLLIFFFLVIHSVLEAATFSTRRQAVAGPIVPIPFNLANKLFFTVSRIPPRPAPSPSTPAEKSKTH